MESQIIYREMEVGDCEQVASLYASCFSHPWSLSSVREMFTVDGYSSLVAERVTDDLSEREIVGYVGMKSVFDEADITNVAVCPALRRHGIAKKLVALLMEEAEKKAIRSIFLEVRASNQAAILLYEQSGFVDCGRRKNYYDAPLEDAILMVREHG